MAFKDMSLPYYLLLSGSLFSLMQCRFDISTEQQPDSSGASNSIEVTSFHIDRQNSLALANWQVFEVGNDIICAPPGWHHYLASQEEFVVLPPATQDSIERIDFARFIKDSKTIDYNSFALELSSTAFSRFTTLKADTLQKLLFQRGFAYARNTVFQVGNTPYKGYCIVYVGDSLVYRFRVILSGSRLHTYDGNLSNDIIGNLQINKHYLLDNANPVKSIKIIK